jgi:hypothetical protein
MHIDSINLDGECSLKEKYALFKQVKINSPLSLNEESED